MNMKKYFVLFLSLCLVIGGLSACKKNTPDNSSVDYSSDFSEPNGNVEASVDSDLGSSENNLTSSETSIQTSSSAGTSSTASTVDSSNTGNTASAATSSATSSKFSKYITWGKSLQNTYTRLKKDKQLKIVYMGGSVTNGYGADPISNCWKDKSFSWFKASFPDANITMVDPSTGESGTHLGTYLVQDCVIAEKPDLVFMEYAINDNYVYLSNPDKFDIAAIKSQCETIIREIKSALPHCDIVMLLTIDQGTASQYSWYYPTAQAHAEIAAAYNLPTVYVGRALADHISSSGAKWSDYVNDIVHPNNKGYAYYWNVLKDYLNTALFKTELKTEYVNNTLPELVCSNLIDGNRQNIFPSQKLASSIDGWTYDASYNLNSKVSTAGSFKADISDNMKPFTFTFKGTEIALYTNLKSPNMNTKVEFTYTVDGGGEQTGYFYSHNPTIIADGLSSGTHTISVKPVASEAISQGFTTMYVSGIFCRDASKQTKN